VKYGDRTEDLWYLELDGENSTKKARNEPSKRVDASSVSQDFRALRISFTLGPSQYATMCLREVTRQDSSVISQREMQDEAAARRRSDSKNNADTVQQ